MSQSSCSSARDRVADALLDDVVRDAPEAGGAAEGEALVALGDGAEAVGAQPVPGQMVQDPEGSLVEAQGDCGRLKPKHPPRLRPEELEETPLTILP